MELYSKYPKFVTFWCFMETVTFAGQLFGWSCLLFILKSEGFYDYTCVTPGSGTPTTTITTTAANNNNNNNNNSNNKNNNSNNNNNNLTAHSELYGGAHNRIVSPSDGYHNIPTNLQEDNVFVAQGRPAYNHGEQQTLRDRSDVGFNAQNDTTDNIQDVLNVNANGAADGAAAASTLTCLEQDSRLNLWFSIAICFSYAMCVILGPLLQKVGMRYFRILLMIWYVLGALCIAFATKVTPWLICPGLCLIGVSGMALYSTNIQMSFLFPRVQSTITAVFVGLYDASTVVTQIVKTVYEHGFQRKNSFLVLMSLHVLMVGTSTLFFLPSVHVQTGIKRSVTKDDNSGKTIRYTKPTDRKSLSRTLVSGQYMLHVYWMSVQAIRFVTFLGFLNAWLETKFDGDKRKESQYLGVFSYTTIGTVLSAITAGLLHDFERKRHQNSGTYLSSRMPIIIPLVVTTTVSIVTTSLTYIPSEHVLYLTFILFTIYRSYLFSFEVTFLNDAFPLEYFAVLFGVLHSSAGLAGMIQYPLFEWYRSYIAAPQHVNMFLIVLEITSFIHPVYIWHRCRKHKTNTNTCISMAEKEIFL